MTIALDRNALTVAGSIDPDFLSIEYLASSILELFTEVPCTVLIDITSTSDVEMSLISENPSQTQWCVALTEVSLPMLELDSHLMCDSLKVCLTLKFVAYQHFLLHFCKRLKTEIC